MSSDFKGRELEDSKGMEEEIKGLPEAYRDVLMLRCLQELSAEQTGELLGISANSVNIRLTRARKALRDRLDKK